MSIREKTKAKDVKCIIKLLKFKYAGHLVKTEGKRWNKRIASWTLYENKMNRGRPKIRCGDEIINKVGIVWKRLAENRRV